MWWNYFVENSSLTHISKKENNEIGKELIQGHQNKLGLYKECMLWRNNVDFLKGRHQTILSVNQSKGICKSSLLKYMPNSLGQIHRMKQP